MSSTKEGKRRHKTKDKEPKGQETKDKERSRDQKKRREKKDKSSSTLSDLDSGVPRLKKEEIVKKEVIGSGNFGVVWSGNCRGMDVAVKILNNQSLDENGLKEFEKEVSFMRQLRHPNIVLFMGACLDIGHLAIVTEFLPKGDLHTILHDPRYQLSFVTKCKMAKDITSGMAWLHNFNPKIIHRDLKPSNLLVDENFRVKLCDFGLSVCNRKDYIQDTDRAIGTPLWMAPEVLTGQPLDEKADVYSYGIVLWELFTQTEPYEEHTQYQGFVKAVCHLNERPPIPADMFQPLARLLQESWHPDPTKRPTMKSILPRISSIMVCSTLPCPVVSRLWVDNWPNLSSVPFNVFADKFFAALHESFNITGVPFRCLERILGIAEDGTDGCVVKLERLASVLAWIGPVEISGGKPWLTRLVELLMQPWFYGDKGRFEIESWLKNGKDGEYLVRFSTTEPVKCPFTISIASKPKKEKKDKKKKASSSSSLTVQTVVNHVRVFYDDGNYYIHKPPPNQAETVSAPNLEALLRKIKEEKALGIKEVCSRGVSMYADLFAGSVGSYFPTCDVGDDDSDS
eukprot:TRINITY_DN7674_c0_g1_i1.p1 TRINITY_DN7674_c0_g1~~TRINITY_DN7674_c0_g1_i1.p1  ORF type:complete len:569 (-),score=106.76 TRINITY_DN7674_c0_g1_i1:7-1713(-)